MTMHSVSYYFIFFTLYSVILKKFAKVLEM